MSMILPKGFFVNSQEIGGAVERINAEPLDLAEIARLWRVYNTTSRRLLDPTAARLENYWWRILGSDGSQLKGATVAKLFLEISDGDSFVPLRSSANRDEGIQLENIVTHSGPEITDTVTIQPSFNSGQSTTSFPTLSKVQVTAMPRSILKKTQGQCTTGPRPSAHFTSPHESPPETSTNPSVKAESLNLHDVQPPLPDFKTTKTEKKATGGRTKKSYIAISTATGKKRPAIRRQGSQLSTNTAAKVSNQNTFQMTAKTVLHGFSKVPHKTPRRPKPTETNEVAWKVEESVPQAVALREPGLDELDKLEPRQEEANVFVNNRHQTSQNP